MEIKPKLFLKKSMTTKNINVAITHVILIVLKLLLLKSNKYLEMFYQYAVQLPQLQIIYNKLYLIFAYSYNILVFKYFKVFNEIKYNFM